MYTVTTRYVIYASRHRRHEGGGVIDIMPQGISHLATGDIYHVPPGFPTLTYTDATGDHILHFAFWSVVGGTEGPIVTGPTDPSPDVTVGTTNIVATAWYIQEGDGPGEGTGITIDAFDESIGNFVFDDFVSISPDSSMNTLANWDGFVSTANAEDITAFPSIHGLPFHEWKIVWLIDGVVTIGGSTVHAARASSAFAFAFYKPSSGGGFQFQGQFAESTWVSWGVKVDGGGPTGDGPVGPWDPTMQEFVAGLALMEVAMKVNAKLGAQVMALAAKQIEMAASAMADKMTAVKFTAPSTKGKG